jgi:cytochrome b6-f complex iron-sulfur subunit
MSSGAILAIVIVALVALGGLFLLVTARRSDSKAATGLLARETVARDRSRRKVEKRAAKTGDTLPLPPSGRAYEKAIVLSRTETGVATVAPAKAPELIRPAMDLDQLGQTRRQFLNRGTIAMFGASLASFGGAVLVFLWPTQKGGFGSKINLGKADEILGTIESKKEPYYNAEARSYIQTYPKTGLEKAKKVYIGGVLTGMEQGIVALYQKCPHLGCKVPWCSSSQWFECPCHGSQYNRVGEKKGGPAPRGMDRFAAAVIDGNIVVDTGAKGDGPAIGVNTTGQEAEGPHCV